MPDAEMADLVQRCIALSPTLTWINNPDNVTTVLWIMGIEIILHAAVIWLVWMKIGMLLIWLAEKGFGLIRRGWAWHRQTPRI